MTILLMGYMGSGKSTIGQKLSKVLNFDFIDLDAYIEKKEGKSIPELFKNKGEIYFRKIESKYLKDVIYLNSTVVSVGGGTPCYGNNMQLIASAENTMSIYLQASIPKLVERLRKEKYTRPLIAHIEKEEDLIEFIGKHLFERSQFYRQSNLKLSIDDKTVDEIVEELVLKLF